MRMAAWMATLGMALGMYSGTSLSDCPTFEDSADRIAGRVEYFDQVLKKLADQAKGDTKIVGPPGFATSDFLMALTGLVTARAKEEARVWLIDQLSANACGDSSRGYFPNVCTTVKDGAYPGPSLMKLSEVLRRDLYSLPACHVSTTFYKDRSCTLPGKDDACIDPYVIEALLVALYARIEARPEPDENLPMVVSKWPGNETFASYLLFATVGKRADFDGWSTAHNQYKAYDKVRQDLVKLLNQFDSNKDKIRVRLPSLVFQTLQSHKANLDIAGLDEQVWLELRKLQPAYMMAAQGNYLDAVLLAADELCHTDGTLPPQVCSRLTVMGEVADADSREKMEAALDRVISPVGAWKRKQSEDLWSLTAMAGVAVGQERLSNDGSNATQGTMGLYMPIAIERSFARDWGVIRSIAVGATALDLGALVSYSQRGDLAGGETSSAPNADWSSVISPGLYVAFALKNSPFRFGLTISRTPELRSVDFGDGIEEDVDSTRAMIFGTIDVTLLGF